MERKNRITEEKANAPQENLSKEIVKTNDSLKRVLVEILVPKRQNNMSISNLAIGLNINSFQLDSDYPPVPISPPPSFSANAADEVVLIRGNIEQGKIQDLKNHPQVIDVWDDPVVEHFNHKTVQDSEISTSNTSEALSTCPISPCDCDSGTAKGTLTEVAQYLGVNKIWDAGFKGEGIVIGIVDGGITAIGRTPRPGETAKIPRVIGGFPSDWGTTAADWGDHGNMTATDALGMAPQAQVYDIRISGASTPESTVSNALQGYQWAIQQHRTNGTPHILSNSWGIYQKSWAPSYAENPNHPFTRKVVEAINEGILVLFAAGNCGETCPTGRCGTDTGPGKSIWGANGHPQVMTVGAVNKNENWIGYSSQGPAALDPNKPDFCSISHFKGYTASDNGTSAACPIAAGVVALLKQANPTLTQDKVKSVLRSTAKDIGSIGQDRNSGAGIIQAKRAFDQI
ncbi:S8 family serine peptidase [Bacillus cereus]|nr:S8 family serine peptidase [Bacillus cereus]